MNFTRQTQLWQTAFSVLTRSNVNHTLKLVLPQFTPVPRLHNAASSFLPVRNYSRKLKVVDDDDDGDAPETASSQEAPTVLGAQKEVVIERRLGHREMYKFPDYFINIFNLRDNPGSRKQPKRVGRGGAHGRTSGRGMKGRKARQGRKPHMLDDGGQDGLRKFPLSDMKPPREALFEQLSLNRVIEFVQRGKLDPSKLITMKELRDTRCCSGDVKYGVLLYGGGCGRLNLPLHIQVTACDDHAKRAVERLGGSLTRVYYTAEGLRAMLLHDLYLRNKIPLPRAAVNWHPGLDGFFDMCGAIIPDRTTLPPIIPERPVMPGRPPVGDKFGFISREHVAKSVLAP